MNTRSNSDKEEIEKAYREALQKTPKPPKPQPKYTSTPYIASESQPSTSVLPFVHDPAVLEIPVSNLPPKSILKPTSKTLDFNKAEYRILQESELEFSETVPDKNILDTEEDRTAFWKTAFGDSGNRINNISTNMNDDSNSSNSSGALRYAVEAVPFFDGQNTPVEYFIEGCELAKSMLPANSEGYLTKIIHTRLTGEARRSVQEHNFTRINSLTAFLKNLFGSSKGLYELQAELGRVYQKAGEPVLPYANRVKAIGRHILGAYRGNGDAAADQAFKDSLEKEMCNSFIRGSVPEIERRIARNLNVSETVQEALRIEKELHVINEIRNGPRTSSDAAVQTCQLCKKPGHTAEKCQLSLRVASPNLGNEILICQICKKRGHSADKCRFRDSSARASVKLVQDNLITCQICNKTGHVAQNCRNLNNRPNIICYNCQKPGHSAKECRSNLNNSNNITCQICNKSGHNAKNCFSNPNRNIGSNNEVCQWCNRRGHQASQCRDRQNSNQNQSRSNIACQLCNKIGHKARECRGNQLSNNNQNNRGVQNTTDQCRYCKATGHLIENCVLREENNRKKQGNFTGSPTAGANRGSDGSRRPVMTAQTTAEITELLE